jgi:NAD(P)-dependent dehydrogenase (short-subunit alcohol dehydrogenase family)
MSDSAFSGSSIEGAVDHVIGASGTSGKPATAPIVLITGGARRIGRALALEFGRRGWDVAIHYRSSSTDAEALVAELQALGRRAVCLAADLADEAAVRNLLPACSAALGLPRCIVNNASLFEEDSALSCTYLTLQKLCAVNLGAPLVLAQALYKALPEADHDANRAVVINLLDQKLFNLNPDYLSYTLTKAALETATTLLAQALAPKLRVVGLAPGLTLPSGSQTDAGFAAAHARTPLRRGASPDDLAQAACYLAEARAVTGIVLIVDGGQHLMASPRDVMFMTGDGGNTGALV